MRYQRERAHELAREIAPLAQLHFQEVATFQDIPLQPNITAYCPAEDAGALRCFTARGESLIGYSIYTVTPHPHRISSKQATNDLLFLHKAERTLGNALGLLRYSETELAKEGVDVVYQPSTVYRDFGALLKRYGYEQVATLYAKRLTERYAYG